MQHSQQSVSTPCSPGATGFQWKQLGSRITIHSCNSHVKWEEKQWVLFLCCMHPQAVSRAVSQIVKLHLKTLNCLSPDALRNSFLWEPEHNSLLLFIHHQLTHFSSKENLYLQSVLWSIFPLCFLTIMITTTNFCLTSFNKPFYFCPISWILSSQSQLLCSSFGLNSPF